MTTSIPFTPSFQSGDKKILDFPALPGAPTELVKTLNPKPRLAALQVFKYTKNDLQEIFKMVLKVQASTCDHDQKISENLAE